MKNGIDFSRVEQELIQPALQAVGFTGGTTGEIINQGNIRTDMFQKLLVAEPEVPGIERVRGNEVDYLMLVKVRPGKQYNVARELRRRIKVCFEKNKIKAGAPAQVYIGQLPAKQ